MFGFGGSLSNDGFRVAIFIGVCFALHIGVVVFVFLYDLYVMSKKKTQIIRETLNEKSMHHREVYNKFYLRGEQQPIGLLCLRKTNT